ncbi:MAG: Asp-tRNA(Asn)/Glu-tRNA(Gln) amidotransferase subunit GatC [Eubacteriaceae bacterium]|nr:Asp-tRNA(Asn)/Glu-tRNA(Gln) amidotransferase subunit GatC [Eubacteriaceae bacterium]
MQIEINEELVRHLENSSFLLLKDDERAKMVGRLSEKMVAIGLIGSLETNGVAQCSTPLANDNAFRNDEIEASLDRKLVLQNAALKTDEAFIAPKTVE